MGNPANTNALLCATSAPSIPKENFTCLTRLDLNRAQGQVSGHVCGVGGWVGGRVVAFDVQENNFELAFSSSLRVLQ